VKIAACRCHTTRDTLSRRLCCRYAGFKILTLKDVEGKLTIITQTLTKITGGDMTRITCFLSSATLFSILSIALSGCSAPRSSGVLIVGEDKYSIAVSGGDEKIVEAKKIAYTEANQECANQGKEILVLSESRVRYGTIDLTFRCLDKDDPEIQKTPVKEKDSGVLIEDQRQ